MIRDIRQQIVGDKDFQWAFYWNRIFLSVFGVWPSNEKESRLKSYRLLLILMIVMCGLWFPSMYALIQVQHKLDLVVDNLLITISNFVAAVKIFHLWYYRSIYVLLIRRSGFNWSRCTSSWERQLMMKHARRGRFLTTFSYISVFIHTIGFLLSPVLDLGIRIVNNITDPNPHRYLPAQSYYPYDYNQSPYYELSYFSQIVAMSISSVAYTTVDTFFNTLVFHASGQSEILAENMSKLCDRQGHQSFKNRAQELIESHTQLVRFVMAIENSFTFAIFIQVCGSMVLICSAVCACIKSLDETPSAKQLSILIAGALNVSEHLIIYCLASEILAINSMEIFNGIYNSKWYNLPPREARYVVLILARTQDPLRLSAGKFFYLSMNAYVQILKSTAGYISMLLTVS